MSRAVRGGALLAALLLATGCGGAEEPDRRAAAGASADSAEAPAADTSFPLRRAPADARRDRPEFEPPEPPSGAAGPAPAL